MGTFLVPVPSLHHATRAEHARGASPASPSCSRSGSAVLMGGEFQGAIACVVICSGLRGYNGRCPICGTGVGVLVAGGLPSLLWSWGPPPHPPRHAGCVTVLCPAPRPPGS